MQTDFRCADFRCFFVSPVLEKGITHHFHDSRARRSGIFYLDSFENLIMNNDNAVYADLLVRRMKERGVFDTLTASIEAEVMSVRSVVSHAFSLLG